MRIIFTLIFSISFVFTVFSQPVISDNWIPEPGDEWKQLAMLDSVNVGPGGANAMWDYSDLDTYDFTYEIQFDFVDPSMTPYSDSFPNSTVTATIDIGGFFTDYGYYQDDGSSFLFLGNGNQNVISVYTDPQELEYIGLEFEETVVDSYQLVRYSSFTGPSMAEGFTSFTYDGYGTLALPSGTVEDAIRIYQEDIEVDSSEGAISTVNRTKTTTYAWIAEGFVFPVAQWQKTEATVRTYVNGMLISEEMEDPEFSFSYNPDYNFTSSTENLPALEGLEVFPTIAKESITVTLKEPIERNNFTIYSVEGHKIDQGQIQMGTQVIDISGLAPGYYLFAIEGYRPVKFIKMH